MEDWTATLVVGAAALAGAVGAYLRKPDQWIFPVVLALVGVVLCGANAVKATLSDGTTIEIKGSLIASATEANQKQSAVQQAIIDELAIRLNSVQTALTTLADAVRKQATAAATQQVSANQQAAVAGTPPVPPATVSATAAAVSAAAETEQQLQAVEAKTANFERLLVKSRDAGNEALAANRRLQEAAKRVKQ